MTAFIHDLGKILAVSDEKLGLIGEAQWCVVGDIFPVGCQFAKENIFYEYFAKNSDFNDKRYNTKYGIYNEDECAKSGLMDGNIIMSWGHDEYMYQICKGQSKLPLEALYMVRFHSFYPWHLKGVCFESILNFVFCFEFLSVFFLIVVMLGLYAFM